MAVPVIYAQAHHTPDPPPKKAGIVSCAHSSITHTDLRSVCLSVEPVVRLTILYCYSTSI